MNSKSNRIVLVSGLPGAGKTTLARPLAAALGFSLLSKDSIKESLFDSLNSQKDDLDYSRLIGGAAMELLWKLAEDCPQVVLEANFRPKSEYERNKILKLRGQIIEVYCRCPVEIASERFAERANFYHPAHPLKSLTAELISEYDRPVGIGRTIEIDTTLPVDIAQLTKLIRASWD